MIGEATTIVNIEALFDSSLIDFVTEEHKKILDKDHELKPLIHSLELSR